mgnify:CR=1 FL=1
MPAGAGDRAASGWWEQGGEPRLRSNSPSHWDGPTLTGRLVQRANGPPDTSPGRRPGNPAREPLRAEGPAHAGEAKEMRSGHVSGLQPSNRVSSRTAGRAGISRTVGPLEESAHRLQLHPVHRDHCHPRALPPRAASEAKSLNRSASEVCRNPHDFLPGRQSWQTKPDSCVSGNSTTTKLQQIPAQTLRLVAGESMIERGQFMVRGDRERRQIRIRPPLAVRFL